jgi:hypothetical protein
MGCYAERTVTSRAGRTCIRSNLAIWRIQTGVFLVCTPLWRNLVMGSGEMLMWLPGNLKIDYRESRGDSPLYTDNWEHCVGCAGYFLVPGEIAFLSTCRTIVATRLVILMFAFGKWQVSSSQTMTVLVDLARQLSQINQLLFSDSYGTRHPRESPTGVRPVLRHKRNRSGDLVVITFPGLWGRIRVDLDITR